MLMRFTYWDVPRLEIPPNLPKDSCCYYKEVAGRRNDDRTEMKAVRKKDLEVDFLTG